MQQFGGQTLELLETLIAAIQKPRSSPSETPLMETFQTELAVDLGVCEQMKTVSHSQTRAPATIMLND